jgi:hypothetical protein
MRLTAGPFSETKELLAGFYLIEAKDLIPDRSQGPERGARDRDAHSAGQTWKHRGAPGA